MSYLDDADHDWRIDSTSNQNTQTLDEMIEEIRAREWDGLRIILQGYAGLKRRYPKASDEECLDTSMVWFYG